MADLVWLERNDSEEPGQASFTMEGGGKSATYLLEVEEPEDCLTAITDLIGDTAVEAGDGSLQRSLPKSHPQYPWFYVSSIDSVKGVGLDPEVGLNLQDANDQLETPPITSQYVLYPAYNYSVKFTPRPYAVVGDDNINLYDGEFYDFDGSLVNFGYVDEWVRYVDVTLMPPSADSFITAQAASQMKFVTSGNVTPGGTPFTGSPRMYLPNQILKVMWYQVPYRYFTSRNSYLNGPAWGTVNQNSISIGDFEFSPGQMLYMGCNPSKYTPPVPQEEPFATVNGTTVFSTDKLMNVEMTWLVTVRDNMAKNLPAAPTSGNKNHVIGGHNLLPWFGTRRFYYAESDVDVGGQPKDSPSFLSWCHEALFCDPDSGVGP